MAAGRHRGANPPDLTPPGEFADQAMAGVPAGNMDLSRPEDRVRLRNWLEAVLDNYLCTIDTELQRQAARGVSMAVVRMRDPDYYEQRRAAQHRHRVAEEFVNEGLPANVVPFAPALEVSPV